MKRILFAMLFTIISASGAVVVSGTNSLYPMPVKTPNRSKLTKGQLYVYRSLSSSHVMDRSGPCRGHFYCRRKNSLHNLEMVILVTDELDPEFTILKSDEIDPEFTIGPRGNFDKSPIPVPSPGGKIIVPSEKK